MAATLHDVARLAGVSIKTVSNVVNDSAPVREQTRARVLAAISQLDYRPNLTARSLRSGTTGVIGLAVPELRLSYFAELADSVMKAAEKRGLTVLIEQTNGDRERELEMLRSPSRRFTDGLIFSVLGMGNEDAEFLRVDYPLVILGERVFHGPADHVTMRNVEAARAATEHLLGLGRRRIAVIGAHEGEIIGSAGLRFAGYREALDAASVPFDPRLVGYTTLWHRSNGAEAMRALLDSGVEFDAVFAFNDTLALGAMRVIQEAGLVVPRDVAVMGFDNLDETAYSIPTLSTVDPGREEIAERAVEVLQERIRERSRNGASLAAPREIETAFRIVGRESTV
ncbi:LacI family transcriptional regulator [Salinibacterium sp. SYSU T00001]|uniref:LacI family DNA-binding transcriptional regulator n=1 Tax=Homoserinimonas sedimenticola TaxID=2986805 RepID=UPI00223586D1|nr:LacI family DNA-binding transcriptional regulator [Salinibacterium sedimenticola]MCW4385217.1 LacI family transcriptional regulator [Salinibacterium sedimenticola]